MQRTQFTCDVCGVEKKESNHWWKMVEYLTGHQAGHLALYRWGNETITIDPVIHICGQDCATRKLSEFMAASTNEPAHSQRHQPVDQEPETGSQSQASQPQWSENGPIAETGKELNDSLLYNV